MRFFLARIFLTLLVLEAICGCSPKGNSKVELSDIKRPLAGQRHTSSPSQFNASQKLPGKSSS